MRLGAILKKHRLVMELQQKTLAAQIGISPAQLAAIENGAKIQQLNGETLSKIVTWLFSELEQPAAEQPAAEVPVERNDG